MILTSAVADPQILAAVRDGVLINDDVAQTIASGLHSPAAKDEQISRLSHGLEFDPRELLARVDQLINSKEFRASDVLLELDALRAWVLTRVPHVEITTVECTADEWAQWAEFGIPADRQSTEVYVVADHMDALAEWVYPGSDRYPADTTGHEVDPDDDGIWLVGTLVESAADILASPYADFWAQEYTTDGIPFQPGGEYTSRYGHPHTADLELKSARLVGFSPDDEAAVYAAWKR